MMIFWLILIFLTILALGFIWRSSWIVPTVFLILVGFTWLQWGNEKDVMQWLELKKLRAELGNSADNVITRLKEQLAKKPDSAKGWYLLGKLYMSQQKFPEAVTALEKSNSLQANDPETMLNYGQALLMAKQPEAAVSIWKKLRTHYPDSSAEAKALDAVIERNS
jgi:cytochrome c-type biogenesis protein CcmH